LNLLPFFEFIVFPTLSTQVSPASQQGRPKHPYGAGKAIFYLTAKGQIMSDCELLAKCPFFNDQLKNMPTASATMKKIYCCWNFTICARYKVTTVLGRKKVPPDLLPKDFRRADEILIQHS
jgi:hypothetical protein